MENSEDFEELLQKEEIEIDEKDPETIKRKIKVVEDELDNFSNVQWNYAKRLLKYGLAAWIFGIAAFVAALVIYRGPGLLLDTPALSISLLVLAGAAPILITVFLIQKYRKKMDRLKRIREGLLSQYEKVLLKKVEENIA